MANMKQKICAYLVGIMVITSVMTVHKTVFAAAAYETDKPGQSKITGLLPAGDTGLYDATLIITPTIKTENTINFFAQLILATGGFIIFLLTVLIMILVVK